MPLAASRLLRQSSAVLVREGAGTRDANYRYVPGPDTRTDIRLATAPGAGDGLELDEGERGLRLQDVRRFYIAGGHDVSPGDPEAPRGPDHIEFAGHSYRVFRVDQWDGLVTAYATRVGPSA